MLQFLAMKALDMAHGFLGRTADKVGLGGLVPGFDEEAERKKRKGHLAESKENADNTAQILFGGILFNGLFPGVMQDVLSPVYKATTEGVDRLLNATGIDAIRAITNPVADTPAPEGVDRLRKAAGIEAIRAVTNPVADAQRPECALAAHLRQDAALAVTLDP